jgi:hypothetical protein
MSSKNNVNPDHYKTRGRERQGEDVIQEVNRQTFAEERAGHHRAPTERDDTGAMPPQTSRKSGVASTSQKEAGARHGAEPEPASNKVPGAFGREHPERADPTERGE